MTTSSYMPDVKVEIAFDSGYATPAGSRTWTDVSSHVEMSEKISISRGRADEFGSTDPNRLALTLDNRDGRFTAGRATSPYYPNIKIGRPIRVTSTPVGGSPSIRFVGYVDQWPVEWPGSDATSAVRVTASSRMARLGFNAPLRSTVAEEFLRSGARHYWPLNEPSGATQATDLAGGATLETIVGPVEFGATTGLPDGSTGLAEHGGDEEPYLAMKATLPAPVSTADPGGIVLETFLTTALQAASINTIIRLQAPAGSGSARMELDLAGGLLGIDVRNTSNIAGTIQTLKVNDAMPHHVAIHAELVAGTTTVDAYVDGKLARTYTSSTTPALVLQNLFVSDVTGYHEPHVIAHVAVNAPVASLPLRAASALTGYADDTASERIERYATYAAIDPAEVVTDPDSHAVAAIKTDGRTVIEAMRVVEETEAGVLFDARDNTLQFRSRADRYNRPVALSLSAAAQQVEAGIAPTLDRTSLTNEVTATAADGFVVRVVDQASVDDYGYARDSMEIASTHDEALQAALWRLRTRATPQPRIPSLGVNLLPLALATQTQLMDADIGSRLAITGLPSQAAASTLEFFIEGYTESIGPESYAFDFNVSPATSDYDLVFTLDDATMGVLDSSYRLAY
jgi:hypothetical protein